jgi:hypothetical protein
MPSFRGLLLAHDRGHGRVLIACEDLGLDNAIWLGADFVEFAPDPGQAPGYGWGVITLPPALAAARPQNFARVLAENKRIEKAIEAEQKEAERRAHDTVLGPGRRRVSRSLPSRFRPQRSEP